MAAKHAGSDKPSDKPSDEAGKSGRAGWRGSGRTAAATSRFSWQQNPNDSRKREVVRKNLRRRVKLAGSAVVLAALLAALGVYLFWRAPATPLFAAAISRYSAPLPPNAWAVEDVARLEALAAFASSTGWYDSRGPVQVTARDPQWDSPEAALADIEGWLEQAHPGGPGKNAVLIYLSAHGVVDREGRPCLVLADASGADLDAASPHLDAARWLRVSDLTARLHKWRPEVNKLLLLDAGRMESNWNIGLLYNGFAEGLDEAVRDAPSVAVLNSTGPGEIGWAAPELQGSAFGFFVCQGLAGDPRADADDNGWISLQELRSYVAARMGDWVGRRRFDVQTPLLVPADREFKLVWARPSSATAFETPAEDALQAYFESAKDEWAEIGALWAEHARLRSSGESSASPAWREHCLLWHEFQQGLVRCEQLALGGPAYRTDVKDALAKLRDQARELAERQPESFPVHSLPLARTWRAWPDRGDVWRKSIMNSFDRPAQPPGPEARSLYLVRADAAWRWLVEGGADSASQRLQPDSVRRILDFVGQPEAPQQAELAEMHFLRMLAGDAQTPGGSNLPPALWQQAATHVLKALAARQAAEQAAAPADERARYAVGKLVEAGDEHLRRAEDALFVGRQSDLDLAERSRQQALANYQQAQAKAELLAAAFAARDRAWADLPYLAQWFARRLGAKSAPGDSAEANDDLLQSAVRAAGRARDLEDLLEQYLAACLRPAEADAPLPPESMDLEARLDTASRQLAVGLDGLAGALSQAVKQVMDQQTSDERTLRDIESLLISPLVSGEQRRSLRQSYQEGLVRRAADSGPGPGIASESAAGAIQAERTFLERISAWPEHPAPAILGGAAADAAPSAESAWRLLALRGDDVRRRLRQPSETAPANSASAEDAASVSPLWAARSALDRAERRLVAGAALGAEPGRDDPARRLLQFDRGELLAWQAQRRLNDFWGPDDSARRKPFYFVAAFQDSSGAARKLDASGSKRWQDLAAICGGREQAAKELVFPSDSKDQPRMRRQTLDKTISLKLAAQLPQGTAALSVDDALRQVAQIREKAATEAAFDARLPALVGGAERGVQLVALVRRASAEGELPPGKPWEQVWFYRGHRQTSEFYPRPAGKSIELVYRPSTGPASVTVGGEAKRPGSVAFILDCSGSMAENRRMTKAKDALNNILRRLAVTGQYQVGLWFYGHRMGVNRAGKLQAQEWNRQRQSWWRDLPAGLHPSEDFQRIVSLASLDRRSLEDVQEAVGTAEAHGETPLYRTIIEVVNQDLAAQPRDLPRRLVVITDGKDETSKRSVEEEDVEQCFANDHRNDLANRIRLDILGVEVKASDQGKMQAMVSDKRVQGKYYDVRRVEELEHVLESALGLYRYSVARAERYGPAEESLGEKTLGETFEIETRGEVKERYRVRLLGTKPAVQSVIELQSHEALDMAVSQASGQWRLRHKPYERSEQTEETAVSPHTLNPGAAPGTVDADFNPAEFYVAAHRPE
ncbi:MAG TPA: vWA domain-containing protein, partial [Pirellulales bacterium]|nr:vWA domain-containing protein [Pirellulales bacterium]